MKKTLAIVLISFFFIGCTMNPSKGARIDKLESEVVKSLEKISQLEKRIDSLEKQNRQLESRIKQIEKG